MNASRAVEVRGEGAGLVHEGASERERIMTAAYRCLIARNGESVPVTEILAKAGLSTRAFYRHFDSKDSLFLALFRRDSERVLAELQSASTRAASPADALREWVEGFMRLPAEPRRRRRVLALTSPEVQHAGGYASELARFMAAQEAALAQILHRGLDDGSFPWAEPEADARAIRAVLGQAFDEQMRRSATRSAADAAAHVVAFAYRALGMRRQQPATPDSCQTAGSAI
ncbi:TetR/AcrR family transcriptional regulator [Nonomuraea sp. NPDC002799]